MAMARGSSYCAPLFGSAPALSSTRNTPCCSGVRRSCRVASRRSVTSEKPVSFTSTLGTSDATVAESFRAIASAISRIGPDRKKVSSPRSLVFARNCHSVIARPETRISRGAAARSNAMPRPTGDVERRNNTTAAASGMHGSTSRTRVTCTGLVLLGPAAARPSTNSSRIPRRSSAARPQNASLIRERSRDHRIDARPRFALGALHRGRLARRNIHDRQLQLREQLVERDEVGVLELLQLAELLAHLRGEVGEHLAVLLRGGVVARLYLRVHRDELVVQLHRLIERALIHVAVHLVELGANGLELRAETLRRIRHA